MRALDFASLKTHLDQKISSAYTPGLQFLVADTSGILFEYNGGIANIGLNEPVTSATQFKMYSATKLMTMMGIMQLVERDKISLNDSINKYLDLDFPKDITIQQVLSHTAGFNKNPFFKELHLLEEDETFDYSDFMAYALPKYNKTIYKAGNKNVYSNYGYLILSAIIEKASNLKYEDYIFQNITSKINLTDQDYLGFKYTNQTATGYQKRKTLMHWIYTILIPTEKYYGSKTKTWQSLNNLYMKGLGFGGGIANARAISALMLALMDHKLMRQPFLNKTFEYQTYKKHKKARQTLGWWHGKVNGHQSFYHPGGGGGYSCEVRIYPDKGLVRVMLMNKTQSLKDLKLFEEIDQLWLKS